ncbi:MAG TPA: hypothetical protein VN408_09510 [Actinoplanes sp.]|nr:hypothetical protein [Actinoplanes sp.]
MPSQTHEALVSMFRDRPSLAADLLVEPLRSGLPEFDEAVFDSAELNDIKPTERHADAVVTFRCEGVKVLAVVIEVQLRADPKKEWTWPAYVATLRDRARCDVALLVICPDEKVAAWAKKPIRLGTPGSMVTPLAVGPGQTPYVRDPEDAREHPELTVLSTIAHADDPDADQRFEAYFVALGTFGTDRSIIYHDLVLTLLPTATRKHLEEYMMTAEHNYTSEWARRLIAEGEITGHAKSVIALLSKRGVEVSDEARAVLIACKDEDQLIEWLHSAATAERVEDLGGALGGQQ